ncbi:MAG: T9SS type A sorting domain-containing protein [Bacteroidales bacterium]|nr:T9SS type A sorting domain-containing protein [Bacteroidales bacterium]
MLKKLFSFTLLIISALVPLCSQTITLTFTGQDANHRYVQLDRVVINNVTKGWQETLIWNDTILTMQDHTGIEDIDFASNMPFQFSQNNPNPFRNTTEVALAAPSAGGVAINITDMLGREIMGTEYFDFQQAGIHQFRLTFARAGNYIITAHQNGQTTSVKMVCIHGGENNNIEYQGIINKNTGNLSETFPKNSRGMTTQPFTLGDQMEYIGYATINGQEETSHPITQAQTTSQTFTLQFDAVQAETPAVTTASVTDYSFDMAIVGGEVVTDGGMTVTARGICWNTIGNPTVNDNCFQIGDGTGIFSDSLTGLYAGTNYYIRAYAINSIGTAYGEEVSFTTRPADGQPCLITPIIMDVDNNSYNTVQIGNQCWMKENLRTTRYADGTPIEHGNEWSTTVAYWYYPYANSSSPSAFGLLYNWKAVMGYSASSNYNPSGVQGICPYGWHVPSDAEWTQLINYVSSQSQYCCNGSANNVAKALSATTEWSSDGNTCSIGNNLSNNNATGFSALPAGDYYYYSYPLYGSSTVFWTTTASGSEVYVRHFSSSSASVSRQYEEKDSGYSVRCLRD